jgi:hypothetical protein
MYLLHTNTFIWLFLVEIQKSVKKHHFKHFKNDDVKPKHLQTNLKKSLELESEQIYC